MKRLSLQSQFSKSSATAVVETLAHGYTFDSAVVEPGRSDTPFSLLNYTTFGALPQCGAVSDDAHHLVQVFPHCSPISNVV